MSVRSARWQSFTNLNYTIPLSLCACFFSSLSSVPLSGIDVASLLSFSNVSPSLQSVPYVRLLGLSNPAGLELSLRATDRNDTLPYKDRYSDLA